VSVSTGRNYPIVGLRGVFFLYKVQGHGRGIHEVF
jgi:hypothetical protein